MPQTQNIRGSDTPYGRGSLHNALLEASFRTRRRAAQINKGENSRLQLTVKMMGKHENASKERQSKVINNIRNRVDELKAYQNVLNSYSADNLETLRLGFKPGNLTNPDSFQRYKLETKIYHCGFTIGTLYPEIRQAIKDGRPEKLKERRMNQLLAVAKRRSDFQIDRRWTNEAMMREKQRELAEEQGLELFITNQNNNNKMEKV